MPTNLAGDMYDTMKSYMDSAQKWAEEICDILEPYIQDPNQRPNDRFMNLAWRLFGANDIATMDGIYSKFLICLPFRDSVQSMLITMWARSVQQHASIRVCQHG